MLEIAVIDDEPLHREILVKYITEWRTRTRRDLHVETFPSCEAFYFAWCGNEKWDVLFLDIMMDGENGVSLARKLRQAGKQIHIIFTTGIVDYMQEGYEVDALHYLLKPLKKEKVWACLEKCLERNEDNRKTVVLSAPEGLVRVDAAVILYAEATGHGCELTCVDSVLQVRPGIQELAQLLSGYGDFLLCHRSYLVNVRRIAQVGRLDLVMEGGATVPVSRRLHTRVSQRFLQAFIPQEERRAFTLPASSHMETER